MKSRINIEKFIESLVKHYPDYYSDILEEQGILYIDDNIVVRNKPEFSITKGQWYKCIASTMGITEGKFYNAVSDGVICDDDGANRKFDSQVVDCFFRPATVDEIQSNIAEKWKKVNGEYRTDGLKPTNENIVKPYNEEERQYKKDVRKILRSNFYIGHEMGVKDACKCFCDNICEKGMSGMCFFKHDHEGQIKNDFRYNECNDLQVMLRTIKKNDE